MKHGNDITLVLQSKKGKLLKDLDRRVKILKYVPSEIKFLPIRKIINGIKKIKFIIKYKNKYDTAISYATYLASGSFVARTASKNSILWCHADYLSLYNGNKEKVEEFFYNLNYDEFSKIVFVSKESQDNFLKIFPKQKNTYFCNNLIDSKKIYKKTEEAINLKYDRNLITFLNVGRHDEEQKKLTRIIEATNMLKKEEYKFRVIFVGDGEDNWKYKRLVKKYGLEEFIIFVGEQENPYPYYKISNCVVLSSDYEGYPVVFLESYILNKPIITTNVSDFKDIQNGRGIIAQKNEKGIYEAMKMFLEKGYKLKKEFNVLTYKKEIEKKLKEIL